jgi:rhodanese-related sulfurtransferase
MKKLIMMSFLSMLTSLFSCRAQEPSYKSLSVNDYERVIADTTVVRLDVRTAEEFAEGHIQRAINMDVMKADFEQKAEATLPKEKTIAVNCRSGKRSKQAAAILVSKGYRVVELDAGFNAWVAAGKKTVVE